MTTYILLIGILLCGIVITNMKIKADYRKELRELMNLFDDDTSR
jgi:ABC-type long-subunit fatty acid transport system fused permease/ATPase subunit